MRRTLTHRPTTQRPPSLTPQTLSLRCALNSNALLLLQRFISDLFPNYHHSSHHHALRLSKNRLALTHDSARMN
jgi:hypothetical protein